MGKGNGVHLGSGIARLLAEAYELRGGPIPLWVRQLVAHYAQRRSQS
jgi:hypothetical protein